MTGPQARGDVPRLPPGRPPHARPPDSRFSCSSYCGFYLTGAGRSRREPVCRLRGACVLTGASSFQSFSLLSGIFRMLQAHLVYFLPQTWTPSFLLVPLGGKLYLEATFWAPRVLVAAKFLIVSGIFLWTD